MTIETTINISDKNVSLLDQYATSLNISRNQLLIQLIIKFMNYQFGNYECFSRVRYQKKKNNEKWKTKHVWFPCDFYEKCIDLRKFHKLSLSFILALAIQLFLDKLANNECDNYNRSYMFFASNYMGRPFFIITWEYLGNEKAKEILKLCENT